MPLRRNLTRQEPQRDSPMPEAGSDTRRVRPEPRHVLKNLMRSDFTDWIQNKKPRASTHSRWRVSCPVSVGRT